MVVVVLQGVVLPLVPARVPLIRLLLSASRLACRLLTCFTLLPGGEHAPLICQLVTCSQLLLLQVLLLVLVVLLLQLQLVLHVEHLSPTMPMSATPTSHAAQQQSPKPIVRVYLLRHMGIQLQPDHRQSKFQGVATTLLLRMGKRAGASMVTCCNMHTTPSSCRDQENTYEAATYDQSPVDSCSLGSTHKSWSIASPLDCPLKMTARTRHMPFVLCCIHL